MVHASNPFAPVIAVQGAPPPELEAAGWPIRRLDGAGPLAAQLYRADLARLDLLWLETPEALLDWDLAAHEVTRIAWDRWHPIPAGLPAHLQAAGYLLAEAGLAQRAAPRPAPGDVPALRALAETRPPEAALPLLRLVAPWDSAARRALVARLTAQGAWAEALHQAARFCAADEAAAGALEGFNRAIAAGELVEAERMAAALAAYSPGNPAVLEAALACNRSLGHAARARRFARALLALDPHHAGAHLVLLEQAVAEGDRAEELTHRSGLALSPPEALHPLRRLHEAHRAISLHLLHPLEAPGRAAVQALVGAARGVDPMALPEGEARHWARHYRHLAEAADAALLGRSAVPMAVDSLHRAEAQPLSWAGLRRQARGAKLAFVVAADAAYLRLYGRAYLTSILRHADLSAVILVHVIGGARQLPDLIQLMDLADPRILYTADDFAPERADDRGGERADLRCAQR